MFKHPAEVCMSYLQHMFFSLEMCFYFFMATITAFIHFFSLIHLLPQPVILLNIFKKD